MFSELLMTNLSTVEESWLPTQPAAGGAAGLGKPDWRTRRKSVAPGLLAQQFGIELSDAAKNNSVVKLTLSQVAPMGMRA